MLWQVNWLVWQPLVLRKHVLLASTSAYKVSKYFLKNGKFQKKDVILQLEAEEDTGSAEEQPASNRFPHYTEIVSGIVIGMAMPFYFRKCHIA